MIRDLLSLLLSLVMFLTKIFVEIPLKLVTIVLISELNYAAVLLARDRKEAAARELVRLLPVVTRMSILGNLNLLERYILWYATRLTEFTLSKEEVYAAYARLMQLKDSICPTDAIGQIEVVLSEAMHCHTIVHTWHRAQGKDKAMVTDADNALKQIEAVHEHLTNMSYR